jgi:transposase-like protein
MNFAFKTVLEFNDYFKDEATCYQFFETLRWGGTPVCPHCGSLKTPYKVKARGKFTDIPSYRCAERQCDLPFTVRTKSIFEGSKVELRKWFLAAYELSTDKKGISSIELATRIGTSQKTAWFINHRLRAMLKETEPTLLKDVAQVDEAYVGGKNKNRHADKKHQHSQGRSGKGKTMVFGARGLNSQVKAQVVPDADRATLFPIIDKWIDKGSIMVSDEWGGYHTLHENYFHVKVNHAEGQYINGCFTTNGIENFWSIFKRGVIGTFHSVSPQHLQAYLDEFTDRSNKHPLIELSWPLFFCRFPTLTF